MHNSDIDRDPANLKLSDAQREIFAGWRRPHEVSAALSEGGDQVDDIDEASMVALNEIDLVQDITTDCSVVASLCTGIARAMKGHPKVSNIQEANWHIC
jgi:calpain-7